MVLPAYVLKPAAPDGHVYAADAVAEALANAGVCPLDLDEVACC